MKITTRVFIKAWLCFCLWLFIISNCKAQVCKHIILISIDGLHSDMYLNKDWPAPNLRKLMREGVYADHLLSVFPSYTYPSHTAMLTGAFPARSKVNFNQCIGSKGEWFWFTNSVKAPILWQALKDKGLKTAAVEWPVSVGAPVTWNLPEIWNVRHPDDRITEARKYATSGLIEEIEQNATGKLDSTNFNDNYFSLDENAGRAAAYIFRTKKPAFLAVHFACVDGKEHDDGRDADSVRLALATSDHAIGDILEAVQMAKLQDSTTIIIVGDHGFATVTQVMRPNMLIRNVPARFISAGGSAFLYRYKDTKREDIPLIIKSVTDSLAKLPSEKRRRFRIIDRKELDRLGADSAALIALTGTASSGLVFSGSTGPKQIENHGPGTLFQNNKLEGIFTPTKGGHHGYDPNIPEMYTGFVACGAGIKKSGHIASLREVDIAPLVAALLGVDFNTPDGQLVPGIIK